ncbi:MAG: hypothetical protein JSR69_02275 [Proteobacteria bacterium]|nr:hypothetical protein [Pseudomonadota bacterium]
MPRRIKASRPLLLSISLSLAACGGGGGGGTTGGDSLTGGTGSSGNQGPSLVTSPDTAEGMWFGTSDAGASIYGVILNDGGFYAVYSARDDKTLIDGVITGTGQSNSGSFTVKEAVDFNFSGSSATQLDISASYFAKSSLRGLLSYATRETKSFTAQYNPVYEQPASASLATGTYAGNVISAAGRQSAFMTLQANGTVTGVVAESECNLSGTATPRGAVNVFNLSLTLRGSSCPFGSDNLAGIGFYDIPSKQFFIAAPNTTRSNGLFFQGVRP